MAVVLNAKGTSVDSFQVGKSGPTITRSGANLTVGAATLTAAQFIGDLTGNADTATALATGRTIGMTGDVAWTSASFDGTGNVTGTSTIQAKAVDVAMLADGTDGELITWSATGVAATVAVGTATHVLTSNGIGVAPTFQVVPGGTTVNTGTNLGDMLSWNSVSSEYDATANLQWLEATTELEFSTGGSISGFIAATGADDLEIQDAAGNTQMLFTDADGGAILFEVPQVRWSAGNYAAFYSTGGGQVQLLNHSSNVFQINNLGSTTGVHINFPLSFGVGPPTAPLGGGTLWGQLDGGATSAYIENAAGLNRPVANFTDISYRFNTPTTAGDPGSEFMRCNNATPASVTEMYFDDTNYSVDNSDWWFTQLAVGDFLVLKAGSNDDRYIHCTVDTITDNTGWWTLAITVVDSGATMFSNNQDVNISVEHHSAIPAAATVTVADTASTSTFITMTDNATGDEALLTDAGLTYNATTAALTATTFVGALSGNATTATTATDATNVTVTTSATSSAFKIPFANTTASTTGEYGLLQDSTAQFTYNPSLNALAVGNITTTGNITVNSGDIDVDQDREFQSTRFALGNTNSDVYLQNIGTGAGADTFFLMNNSASYEGLVIRNLGAVELYHADSLQFQTSSHTASDKGTGAEVVDGLGTLRPVGFNTIPVYEIDVADTFDLAHVGMLWHKDSGVAVTFTCNSDTTIPQGASYMVHNDDTEDLTIAEGTATIEFLSPGAVPVGGNVTVEQGGIVTVYKYTDAIFWVWGAKSAAAAANVTVTTSSTSSAFKVPFANTTASTTGDYGLLQDTTATFTYNPSTNTLVAGTFSGALSGNATTATTATNATNVNVLQSTASASRPFVFALNTTAGNKVLYTDSAATCYINPTTNVIGATTFIGALTGNATTATAWATGRTITLSGDVSGTSPAWTGSGNLAFTGTVVANDSHTHAFNNLTSKENGTGIYRTTTNFQATNGLIGTYDDAASSSWGGPIWGMDDGFTGPTGGTSALATGTYGMRWNRASSTQAHADIGEGLYVYQNGVLEGGIGTAGIYSAGTLDVTGVATFNNNVLLLDNDEIQLGTPAGGDAQIYSNGTDLYMDLTSGRDFRLRHITENMIVALANADVYLYNNGVQKMRTDGDGILVSSSIFMDERTSAGLDVAGDGQLWVKNNAPNDLYFTTDNGIDYPVGYATYRRSSQTVLDNANQTLNMSTDSIADAMVNGCWYSDNATAYTLTLEPSTDTQFQVGAQLTIWNEGAGTLTINEGAGTTLYILDGSARTDTAGGMTMGLGGYCTIIRKSTTVYLAMGAGLTA